MDMFYQQSAFEKDLFLLTPPLFTLRLLTVIFFFVEKVFFCTEYFGIFMPPGYSCFPFSPRVQ